MEKYFAAALLTCISLAFSGCGKSKLSSEFTDAGQKQDALNSGEISIWARSPTVDARNFSLTASDDLSIVPRARKKLYDLLDVHGPLSSIDLKVAEEIDNPVSVSFFDWAGREVNWKSPDFDMFMAFHHIGRALIFTRDLLQSDGYNFRNPSNVLLPLKVFAKQRLVHNISTGAPTTEVGDALQTQYDPFGKQILFYGQFGNILPDFNPVQEADAIYHEFGHVVQHMVNKVVMESAGNTDNDALLEGLADFYSAAVIGDDRILSYLEANSPTLFGESNLNGSRHIRQLNHGLTMPNSYTTEIHLNGRVVAGALNEFRKYLVTSGFSVDTAFQNTTHLAYLTLGLISTTTSLRGYADLLVSKCQMLSWCSGFDTQLKQILVNRGLSYIAASPDLKPSNASAINSATLGFLEFPSSDYATVNGQVDSCEVVMIFPNLKGIPGLSILNGRFYDSRGPSYQNAAAQLLSYSGASQFMYPAPYQTTPVEDLSSANIEFKSIPWLESGDILQDLVRDLSSKVYRSNLGAAFTQKLGINFYPSPLGWLVRAGQSGSISATFKISLRAFNNKTVSDTYISNSTYTFSVPIRQVTNSPLCR